jgi:hypothetical protein
VRIQLAIFAVSIVTVVACGARTGLPVDEPDPGHGGHGGAPPDAGPDAAPDAFDAGPDAFDGAPFDAAPDAFDAAPDAFDAAPDVFDASDAPDDVLDAPDDVFDAPDDVVDAAPDVVVNDCQDAGVTYIYLIAGDNSLIRFDPPSKTATVIGTISCPIAMPQTSPSPYSMAVDRQGIAHVVFTDGELFRVSTASASCAATTFQINQGGYSTQFGMGFSADNGDPGETLFVAGNQSMELATLDTTTLQIAPVGVFSSPIGEAELTGTGAGDLYAFGLVIANGMTNSLHLAQIDKLTATVIQDDFLTLTTGSAQIFDWAFAYWGGGFYFFTSVDGMSTNVSLYTPGGSLTLPVVATIPHPIVGAGVSTCAPQH